MTIRRPYRILLGAMVFGLGVWMVFLSVVTLVFEREVWEKNDFSLVGHFAPQLVELAQHRLTPLCFKTRLFGLASDGYLANGEAGAGSMALEKSFDDLHDLWGVDEGASDVTLSASFNPIGKLPDSQSAFVLFSQGYDSWAESTPVPDPIDDSFFLYTLDPVEGENALDTYRKIQLPSEEEITQIRSQLQVLNSGGLDYSEIGEICAHFATSIDQLKELGEPFLVPKDELLQTVKHLPDFVRLLTLDAAYQLKIGNKLSSIKSLDSAYKLLGYVEQNPCLVSLIVDYGLRDKLLKVLPKSSAEVFGLNPKRRIPPNLYEIGMKAEYQKTKRQLWASMDGHGRSGEHMGRRMQEMNFAFYQSIFENPGEASVDFRRSYNKELVKRTSTVRRLAYKAKRGSVEDGEMFAETSLEACAFIVSSISRPNLGNLSDIIEELKQRESNL